MLYKQERLRVRLFREGIYTINGHDGHRVGKKGKEDANGMVNFIQVILDSETMDARGRKGKEG